MSNEQGEPSLPITIFYSYASSKKDEPLQSELEKHLSLMRQLGFINEWSRRDIKEGNISEACLTVQQLAQLQQLTSTL